MYTNGVDNSSYVCFIVFNVCARTAYICLHTKFKKIIPKNNLKVSKGVICMRVTSGNHLRAVLPTRSSNLQFMVRVRAITFPLYLVRVLTFITLKIVVLENTFLQILHVLVALICLIYGSTPGNNGFVA